MDNFQTISVIGLGYIGLPTAAMFASRRRKVIGVDVNARTVDTVNRGQIHIVEPELDMIVQSVVSGGYLRATTRPEAADAFLIAVPTPFKGDHVPDLSFVQAAAESIAPVLRAGNLVVLESTSPVGTTEAMVGWLAAKRPDLRFPLQGHAEVDLNVAYCPERVLPGQVVRELVDNDRIIGGLTPACSQRATALYRIFVTGELLVSNARTAEMCKLTENSYRDVNIAFANELSIICAKLGIDVWELIRLANHHPRVKVLQPGAGVGGHCIAVDPWFIVDKTPDEARLIRTAREVNDGKPEWVVAKVRAAVAQASQRGADPTVALFGLAFKPNIDDLRESPALHIAEKLVAALPARYLLVEPNVQEPPATLRGLPLVGAEQALFQADVVVLLVAHSPFAAVVGRIDPQRTVVVDAVGLLASR